MQQEGCAHEDRSDIEQPIEIKVGFAQPVRPIAGLEFIDAGDAECLHRAVMHIPEESDDPGYDEDSRRYQHRDDQGDRDHRQAEAIGFEHIAIDIGSRHHRDEVRVGDESGEEEQQGSRLLPFGRRKQLRRL